MKGLIFVLTILLAIPTFAASKIGKVNIQKVLVSVNEGKRVRGKLKKEFEKKQAEIKKEENSIRKLQESFKKQSLVMNEKKKLEKEREIQQKIITLQQKTVQYQKDIQGKEQKMKKPILERVRVIIEDVSKSGKYDMIFEVSMSPVYLKEHKDITDDVIKAYNKKHK